MVSIMVSIGSTTVTFFSFSKVEPTSGIVEPNQQQTMTLTFRRGVVGLWGTEAL